MNTSALLLCTLLLLRLLSWDQCAVKCLLLIISCMHSHSHDLNFLLFQDLVQAGMFAACAVLLAAIMMLFSVEQTLMIEASRISASRQEADAGRAHTTTFEASRILAAAQEGQAARAHTAMLETAKILAAAQEGHAARAHTTTLEASRIVAAAEEAEAGRAHEMAVRKMDFELDGMKKDAKERRKRARAQEEGKLAELERSLKARA